VGCTEGQGYLFGKPQPAKMCGLCWHRSQASRGRRLPKPSPWRI